MSLIFYVLINIMTLGILVVPVWGQEQTAKATEALETIANFADRLCQTVPLETSSHSLDLSGSAKADLNGIIAKLAKLGISGAAKYESSSSQNVLQKDLAEVLKESRNCRLHIWDDLKLKLDISQSSEPKACRDKSHGVERYAREFETTRTSHFMGGGYDQPKWCNDALAQLRSEHPEGQFEQLGSSENTMNTCPPFNCPQYQYHCKFRVRTDPVYVKKISTLCRHEP